MKTKQKKVRLPFKPLEKAKRRHVAAGAVAAALIFSGAIFLHGGASSPVLASIATSAGEVAAPAESKTSFLPQAVSRFLKLEPEGPVGQKLAVAKGDTLMDLLMRNNISRADAYGAIEALRKVYNPRNLAPDHAITVFFHRDPSVADPSFVGLQIDPDKINTVTVNRSDDGSYKVDKKAKAVYSTLRGFRGTIDNSLYVSAKAQGLPDGVIIDLIRMYSWNVDFQRDIQGGDAFEVMYEQYATETGDILPDRGEIVYAKLTLSGKALPFYLYKEKSGAEDYYDTSGHSAKKSLMKTPIDGARLSSGFGMRRHPVLGYSKMHKGIDFAAPKGTPIYAAGDGVIEKIGPYSSYGKYIRLRHRRDLQTAYAHMSGFKSGLKSGARVKQGQVIGYVGTTGRSTGPHLHYEIILNGKQVNPKGLKLPTGKALAGATLNDFRTVVSARDSEFRALGESTQIASGD